MASGHPFPPTQRIGIFVYENFEPIDVFGFLEAFSIARFLGTSYASPPPYPFEIFLIGKTMANVKSINGPSVAPDWDFARALQEPLDLLMVPGGGGTWPLLDSKADPAGVAALLDWMRAMDRKVRSCRRSAPVLRCSRPAASSTAFLPRPIMARSTGSRARTTRALGSRVAMGRRGKIRHLGRRLGRHGHGLLSGVADGRAAKWPRSRFGPPNMTGTATPRRRSITRRCDGGRGRLAATLAKPARHGMVAAMPAKSRPPEDAPAESRIISATASACANDSTAPAPTR